VAAAIALTGNGMRCARSRRGLICTTGLRFEYLSASTADRGAAAGHTSPPATRARAHARGHQLGEHVDRHARAAKHRIPAHDLVYQPILGRRSGRPWSALGSSGLARPGRRRCARFQKQSEKIKRCGKPIRGSRSPTGQVAYRSLSAEFGVHPTMISGWKQELVPRANSSAARFGSAPRMKIKELDDA